MIAKSVSAEVLEKHDFLVGTPFAFQGEEKDIMLISLALDKDSHASAFQYLNKEDVFNVCITRARTVQYIYASFDYEQLKNTNLAAQYLRQIDNFQPADKISPDDTRKDIFMQDVLETIQKIKPDEVLISFPIAGVEIDLVALERWRMLERVGLRTFFLPYSQWYFDRRKCQKALLDFLETEMLLVA